MKAQTSRNSHRADRRYTGVYQQQGRMITDADWNELVDVVKERARLALACVVGSSGVPRHGGALAVTDSRTAPGVVQTDAELRWGALVVDGIAAEVVAGAGAGRGFDYTKQRSLPFAPTAPSGDVTFYADVWERLVVSLEDDNLRDSALHGVDTCVRTQVLAQIKCATSIGSLSDLNLNPARGNALLELERPLNSTDADDPCATATPIANDLGNYLFRLEVHDVKGRAGEPDEVVLTWSSENGAEAHPAGSEPPEFKQGGWVYDFFSDTTELHLGVHLMAPSSERSVLVTNGYPVQTPKDARNESFPFVRRWDGYCILRRQASDWSFFEGKHKGESLMPGAGTLSADGKLSLRLDALVLRLNCGGKRFVAGDYWLALLREHPEGRQPELLSSEPVGIVHHYLRLLTHTAAGTTFPKDAETVQRLAFPALTELVATRVGYDPSIATGRWRDINEPGSSAPATVQDAIDQLAANLEAADIAYALPGCGTETVESLFQSLPHWPDLDQDGLTSVQDLFKALLCHLDASRIPYAASVAGTIRSWLDTLRADVEARVKIAGDTMTGKLIVNAQVGINEPAPGGTLHVKGGHPAKSFHGLRTAIEVDNPGDGNVVLQANGATGPFRLAVEDGQGSVNQTVNAYDSAGIYRYDVAGGATWLRFNDGTFSVRTGKPGAADAPVAWKLGFCQIASGFVGVGTDAPSDALDVSGRVAMTGFRMPTGATDGFVLTSDSAGAGTWKRSVSTGWLVAGTNLISDVTGNVGIGTPNPTAKLQVVGGAIQPAGGNMEAAGIMFPKDPGGGAGDAAWIRYYARAGENTTLEIGTSNDPDDHIALMPSGNVGIGTPNPIAKLQVVGGAIQPTAGNVEAAGIMFPKDPGGGSGDAAWIRYYARSGENTTLEIGTSNDPQDHIALMASGGVGIGTNAPSTKLHVVGDITVTGLVDGVDVSALKSAVDARLSTYTKFTDLSQGAATVSVTFPVSYQKLAAGTHTFTKNRSETRIEVHVHSRFAPGNFGGGATGIRFQVRVNDVQAPLFVDGAIVSGNVEFLSLFAMYLGLASGQHTVTLWALVGGPGNANSLNVRVDPGNHGGSIIVKETW